MIRRLILLGGCMALALGLGNFLPAAAAESICELPQEERPPEPEEPAELCGLTRFVASQTSVMRVTIPAPTSLLTSFTDPDRDIDIQGAGRLAGFVLIEDQPQKDGARFFAGRFLPATADRWFSFVDEFPFTAGVGYQIPAGDYLLYVVADGSPVTVTLKLDGLDGWTDLLPTRAPRSELRTMTERSPDPTNVNWFAGDTGELFGRGFVFRAINVHGTDLVSTHYGLCVYDGVPDEPPGYGPRCPGSLAGGNQTNTGIPGTPPGTFTYSRNYLELTDGLPAGTYAQGAWAETVAGAPDATAVAFWLTYDD